MGKYIVLGGGPVGCLAALQLTKLGHQVTVYEGRNEIPNDPEQSYPIGVNPRGLHAIELVVPEVATRIRQEGRIIDAWEIYAGPRQVANQKSGVVYGTSRGAVNLMLWEACQAANVTLLMNHRLKGMDFDAKTLTFKVYNGANSTETLVDASDARIVGADGVHSTVRSQMQKADSTLQVVVTPWVNEYRVLFGNVGELTNELNPAVHYIFSGGYTAVIDNHGRNQWTLVTTVRDTDSSTSPSQLVYANEATKENVSKLRAWIQSIAPSFLALLSDEELQRYFSRRTYRGAVVECNKYNYGEWVVLLGDAAHSVLPPTGEGINSGLEDTLVLAECTKQDEKNSFGLYTKQRKPDIEALQFYANHLNAAPSFSGERIARLLFMIIEGSSKLSVGQSLFGPLGINRWPYKKIIETWRFRRSIWLNLARSFTYPIAGIFTLLALPFSTRKKHIVRGELQGVV